MSIFEEAEFIEKIIENHKKHLRELTYTLVDYRIKTGVYKSSEREQRFQEIMAVFERAEREAAGTLKVH